MVIDASVAAQTAAYLLQIKAIKLQPEQPFVWASGWKSPIYCDNRLSLSYPKVRNFIKENLIAGIREKFGEPEVIAGVATGAIAIGILVAQEMNLPFIYVRPEPKAHGRQNQIEGHLGKGARVVVIEDLISTGGSSLNAVEALRKEDCEIKGMAAIFTYAFEKTRENFQSHQVDYFTLCDYPHLIEKVKADDGLSESTLELLQAWRRSPNNWSNE